MEENVLTQQEPETIEVVEIPQAQEQQMPPIAPLEPQEEKPVAVRPMEVAKPEKPAKKQKKEKKPRETVKKDRVAPKLLSPAKIGSFIMFLLQAAIVALCGIQLVIWGISIAAHNADYISAIMSLDYVNIVMIVIMLIFIAVMVGTLICSILSILKKNAQFVSLVTTFLAFYIFCKFIPTLFNDRTLLVEQMNFYMLNFVAVLVLVYAVLRLIDSDIRTRIVPFVFSLLIIALAIAMFMLNVGDFVRIDIQGYGGFTVGQLNPEQCLQTANAYFAHRETLPLSHSSMMFVAMYYDDVLSLGEFSPAVLLAVAFVAAMVAKMLPYMALSLLGYMLHGLLCKNYEQYYNLLCCKKVLRMMLTTAILGLLCAGYVYLGPLALGSEGYMVTMDVLNCGLTVGLCIVGMILTSVPWNIYNKVYKRKFKRYKANEGRTQYGTSAM